MIKIFTVAGTRGFRPLWLCEELGIPYEREIVSFDPEYRARPEWRQLNPVGKVPVMTDGHLTMFESCAMVDVILERYGNGRLQPERGSNASALMQQWSWFAESTLARPIGEIVNHRREFGAEAREEAIAEMQRRSLLALTAIDQQLSDQPFILDWGFSAADINLGWSLMIAKRLVPFDHLSNASEYYERLSARPAFQAAV
jgi:glutathione S-transferase